mgnify:CR=1 FL=1
MIKARDITFEYIRRDENGNVLEIETALDKVNVTVKKGEFVAILGHNGSGKSTFAKHVNAIFSPGEGEMYVDGLNTHDLDKLYEIRQRAGMVFQNPDNQIISSVVEEDVAFGPENLGVPTEEIRDRVKGALGFVNMYERRHDNPGKLSGGQKQRVAIAGVLAMEPKCIVLDEPTAMLDPKGRLDVIQTIKWLNENKGITILLITHNMEETIDADRIIVMDKGRVRLSGTPREVYSNISILKSIGLDVPFATGFANALADRGIPIERTVLDNAELANRLDKLMVSMGISKETLSLGKPEDIHPYERPSLEELKGASSLILDHVGYTYGEGTVYEKKAVVDADLTITKGEFIGIVGHTGSGKSTLIQMLNALLKPTSGKIYFNGQDISEEGYSLKFLRSKVGMSFQYPEHQLFADTVVQDVAFGPKNLGWDNLKVDSNTFKAIKAVGLSDECYDMSPLEMSGGQKRRVCLAGVLAMEPDYIILDEPTAGLDPKGRDDILELINSIHKESNITVVLVSHSMDDVAKYADRLIVVDDGVIRYDDVPKRVFLNVRELKDMGLDVPNVSDLFNRLSDIGYPVDSNIIDEEKAIEYIAKWFI